MNHQLSDLFFDKGNGAIFSIEWNGQYVRCFVSQDNLFLYKKNDDQDFQTVFKRYASLIADAAVLNINLHGISQEPWGNLITENDIAQAQELRPRASPRSKCRAQ